MGEHSFYYLKWVICLNKRWAPENLLIPFFPLVWENKRRLTPSPCTGTHTHTRTRPVVQAAAKKRRVGASSQFITWAKTNCACALCAVNLRIRTSDSQKREVRPWNLREPTFFYQVGFVSHLKKSKKKKKIKATEKRRKCIYYTTEMLMDLSTVKQITRIIWISYMILRDVTSVSTDTECVILTLTSHSMDLCRCLSEHRDGCESSLHDNGPQ